MIGSGPASLDRDGVKEVLTSVAEYGVASGRAVCFLDVGSEPFLEFFRDEIQSGLLGSEGSTCRFFEGAYGEGKSHLLTLLCEQALDLGMAAVRTELSEALSLRDWKLITKNILAKIEIRMDGELISGLPLILAALAGSGANETALRDASLPHAGFRTGMLQAMRTNTDEAWDLLQSYLLGERVAAFRLRSVGLRGVKNPLSPRNAEMVLGTALGGLRALGVPGTMMLFDETEDTFSGHGLTKLSTAANLMRRLIDSCINGALPGTIAVFAVLPGFVADAGKAYQALGQRIAIDRLSDLEPSWRWPVLPVEALSATPEPEQFLEGAIYRMVALLEVCRESPPNFRDELWRRGRRVLEQNAGTGYRRELMKALASHTLRQI